MFFNRLYNRRLHAPVKGSGRVGEPGRWSGTRTLGLLGASASIQRQMTSRGALHDVRTVGRHSTSPCIPAQQPARRLFRLPPSLRTTPLDYAVPRHRAAARDVVPTHQTRTHARTHEVCALDTTATVLVSECTRRTGLCRPRSAPGPRTNTQSTCTCYRTPTIHRNIVVLYSSHQTDDLPKPPGTKRYTFLSLTRFFRARCERWLQSQHVVVFA